MGFEALSRGAGHVTFLETDGTAFALLYANARRLGVENSVEILRVDATRAGASRQASADFLFMDPPYNKGLAPPALLALQGWLSPSALLIVEVAAKEPFESPLTHWTITDERIYGAARLVFLRSTEEVTPLQ